eukprot:2321060-Rhodomonas_salina.1
MKVEELRIAHPHHALLVVDRKSEVLVVEVFLRTTVQHIESEENADQDQLNLQRIEKKPSFSVPTSAPASLRLRDLECTQSRFHAFL